MSTEGEAPVEHLEVGLPSPEAADVGGMASNSPADQQSQDSATLSSATELVNPQTDRLGPEEETGEKGRDEENSGQAPVQARRNRRVLGSDSDDDMDTPSDQTTKVESTQQEASEVVEEPSSTSAGETSQEQEQGQEQERDGDAAPEVEASVSSGDPMKLLEEQIEKIMHADMSAVTLKSVREALRSSFGYSKEEIRGLKPTIKSICEAVAMRWRDPANGEEEEGEEEEEEKEEGEEIEKPQRKRLKRSESGKSKRRKKLKRVGSSDDDQDPRSEQEDPDDDDDSYKESGGSSSRKASRKSSAGRSKKRKGPKRALTAYSYFVAENTVQARAENPDLNFGQISRILGERWRNLSVEDREPYEEQAGEDKLRYQRELRLWKLENPEEAASSSARGKAGKRKRRRPAPGEDGEYFDGQDEYGSQDSEVSAFDKLVNSVKTTKLKPRSNIGEIRDDAEFFVKRMVAAWEADLRAWRAGEPAINRMSMLKEVVTECGKQILQEHLMDQGILKAINLWLKPFANRKTELPNINLRRALYGVLAKLPVEESHLVNSDGLGRRINRLWQREPPKSEERAMLQQLLERWMRPVVGSVTDYKKLEHMERKHGKQILERQRVIMQADEKRKGGFVRSAVPQQATFDFLLRPESHATFEDEGESRGTGLSDMKRQLKRGAAAKGGAKRSHHSSVNVSGNKRR